MPPVDAALRGFPSCRRALAAAAIAAALAGCTGKVGGGGGAGGTGGSTGLPPGATRPITPGRVVAHRLNNVEYDNTVRDLVGVDLKPSSTYGFPDDAYAHGFDNNSEPVHAHTLLLEKLETATQAIVTAALSTTAGN